jgi:hypothetical protein
MSCARATAERPARAADLRVHATRVRGLGRRARADGAWRSRA